MNDLLSEQGRQVDWVIVDGPPLAAFPDSHVLASLTDGVVIVVEAGHTPLAAVESVVKMVGRERIVGIVLNRSSAPPRVYYERQDRTNGLLQRCSRFFCRA
jgi:tyrosine-protein kinase Etk/Wzc